MCLLTHFRVTCSCTHWYGEDSRVFIYRLVDCTVLDLTHPARSGMHASTWASLSLTLRLRLSVLLAALRSRRLGFTTLLLRGGLGGPSPESNA